MPQNDRIIVGIDIGSHKVCTIVAEASTGAGSRLNVLGVGAVASEGVSKGLICDIVKASSVVSHSLETAERQSGCRILSAFVSISGNHISSMNSRGLVAVSHPDRVIGQDDVDRAVESARAVEIAPGRDVLHVIPRTYTVDGQDGIYNPVGLSGFRLEVEAHIVTAASNVRENLVRCVQQADVEVDDLVLSPLASAEAVLTEQEKRLGVALVDIGHGTTDIAIYAEGAVWHTRVIPVGGWHLTNDLVIVCNIPYEAAEALKLQYGQAVVPGANRHSRPAAPHANGKSHPQMARVHAYTSGSHGGGPPFEDVGAGAHLTGRNVGAPDHDPDDEMIETHTFEGATRLVPRSELNEVMAARLDQLFTMVGDEIRRSGYEGLLPAGVVLTGGVASMPGIEPLASHKLKMPVRVGRPGKIDGLADVFEDPSYATSAGLVLWGLKHHPHTRAFSRLPRLGGGAPGLGSKPIALQGTLAKWLKSFLPSG